MTYRTRTATEGYRTLRSPKSLERGLRRANLNTAELARLLAVKPGPACTRQYLSAMLHGDRARVGSALAVAIEQALQAKPGSLFAPDTQQQQPEPPAPVDADAAKVPPRIVGQRPRPQLPVKLPPMARVVGQ